LAPGEHWTTLRSWLRERSVSDILTELPESVPEEVRELAVAASMRLKQERSLEFGHAVTLELRHGSIRFEPISQHGNAVQVPFKYVRAEDWFLRGALRLRTPKEPLALVVNDRSADPGVIGEAWALGLSGYAELTCTSGGAEPAPALRSTPDAAAGPSGGATKARRNSTKRAAPGERTRRP
jgi:hypothetical protein